MDIVNRGNSEPSMYRQNFGDTMYTVYSGYREKNHLQPCVLCLVLLSIEADSILLSFMLCCQMKALFASVS